MLNLEKNKNYYKELLDDREVGRGQDEKSER